jgi:hypothetical protein
VIVDNRVIASSHRQKSTAVIDLGTTIAKWTDEDDHPKPGVAREPTPATQRNSTGRIKH